MSDGRTERLLALLLALTSAHRPLTRHAIRDAVGEYQGGSDAAFERKFERDKDELRRFGIPIRLATDSWGEAVGYELERAEMFLPEIEFDSSERLVVTLAARAWGQGALSGLRKLETAAGSTTPDVEGLRVESRVDPRALGVVMAAINDRQAICFDYRGTGDAAPIRRRVQPWAITAERGHWYVVGWDEDRCARRVFRISRVVGRISGQGPRRSYDIPDDHALEAVVKSDWEDEADVLATVRLVAGAGHAIRLLGRVIDHDDTHDVIRIDAIQPKRLLREVLRCGSTAQMLTPPSLVAETRAALETLVAEADASPTVSAEQVQEWGSREAVTDESSSSAPITASQSADRLARLLALVPWLEANPGVTISVAAAQFGLSVEQLREDLTLAVCTEFGAFHSTLDIDIYGSALTVRDSQGIKRPLRLSSHEAAALLLGLAIIRSALAGHESATIDRVATKLRAAAAALDENVDHVAVVIAETEPSPCEATVEIAVKESRLLRITYWSATRDAVTERTVEPVTITWSDGRGYLEAWCYSSRERRTFRVDRILEATLLDRHGHSVGVGAQWHAVEPQGPAALLVLEPSTSWFTETVPHHWTIDLPDGRTVMSLPVASHTWATRTVLAMAGAVRVVAPTSLAEQIIAEAQAALAQY